MNRTNHRTRSTMLIGSAAAAILLAGCSGDDTEADDTASQSEPEQEQDQARSSATPVGDLPAAPELEDSQGARRDARFDDCSLKEGKVNVPGQVTNSQKEDQDYVVSVSWIVEGSQVVARGVAEVKGVPAGETEQFEIDAKLDAKALECTYNVRRAPSA